MRVAVTGASGFLGRYVLQELLSRGLETVAITRSRNNLPGGMNVPEVLEMDIHTPPNDPFATMGRPDVLIHLAWGGLPNYHSRRHTELELPAQIAFLSGCVAGGLKRLVVTGTCYEYGLCSGELTEASPTNPCTEYGRAKELLHARLLDLQLTHDFELAWLRLFYLFGPGQAKTSLYSMLLAAIDRREEAFDMSGGEQVRDFLPVREATRLIVEVALRRGADGSFNICSGSPVSIRELVRTWIDESHAKIRMNLGKIPYSPSEPMAFWGSRRKLDELLKNGQ